MISKTLIAALVVTAQSAAAEEVEPIKFICVNPYSVSDVVHDMELVVGLSELPSGCEWVPGAELGVVGETEFYVDAPDGKYARVSKVTVAGKTGFSAGIIDLLS